MCVCVYIYIYMCTCAVVAEALLVVGAVVAVRVAQAFLTWYRTAHKSALDLEILTSLRYVSPRHFSPARKMGSKGAAVEKTWNIYDSQDQILVLT